ncbi:MAG: hypothetical protein PHN61_12310 [Methanothrix sp.]|nr:hypothetical protein [Methanothrix sp.]
MLCNYAVLSCHEIFPLACILELADQLSNLLALELRDELQAGLLCSLSVQIPSYLRVSPILDQYRGSGGVS